MNFGVSSKKRKISVGPGTPQKDKAVAYWLGTVEKGRIKIFLFFGNSLRVFLFPFIIRMIGVLARDIFPPKYIELARTILGK